MRDEVSFRDGVYRRSIRNLQDPAQPKIAVLEISNPCDTNDYTLKIRHIKEGELHGADLNYQIGLGFKDYNRLCPQNKSA